MENQGKTKNSILNSERFLKKIKYLAIAYAGIGSSYKLLNKYKESLEYYKKAYLIL